MKKLQCVKKVTFVSKKTICQSVIKQRLIDELCGQVVMCHLFRVTKECENKEENKLTQ